MSYRKKCISLISILLCLMLLTTTAFAAWSSLGVALVRQAKTQWCWAASLEMCASYLGYSDYDQWDIVRDVILIYCFAQKYFQNGMMAGGIKG